MGELQPYLPQNDNGPWGAGQAPPDREETKYTFTTLEALYGHFSQWLPQARIHAIIENEKEVFIVRKEVSLGETQMQFLKKCENSLLKAVSELDARNAGDWGSTPSQA